MDSNVTDAGMAGALEGCRQSVAQLNEIEELDDGTLVIGTQYFLPDFAQVNVRVRLGESGLIYADDGGLLVEFLAGRELEIAELVEKETRSLGVTFTEGEVGACIDRPEHTAGMVVAVAKAVATIAERLAPKRKK